jgi:hypothetical protein
MQKRLLWAQKPLRHLIGAFEGHIVSVQFVVVGSMQTPEAHLSGVAVGQPLASGHWPCGAQDPSGQSMALAGQAR